MSLLRDTRHSAYRMFGVDKYSCMMQWIQASLVLDGIPTCNWWNNFPIWRSIRHYNSTVLTLFYIVYTGFNLWFVCPLLGSLAIPGGRTLMFALVKGFFSYLTHIITCIKDDWRQIGGHWRPSHHQHILMSEKIHDDTHNVTSSIVLMKGHVPSLTTGSTCGLTTSSTWRRLLDRTCCPVCIQIAINNDQGCPAMGWDATSHHHTATAKRTSLSKLYTIIRPSEWCRLNRDSFENSTASHSLRRHLRWARDHRRRSAGWRGSRSVRTQGPRGRMWCSRKRFRTVLGCIRRNPGMVREVTPAVLKRLRKCVTLMYWSCLCDATRERQPWSVTSTSRGLKTSPKRTYGVSVYTKPESNITLGCTSLNHSYGSITSISPHVVCAHRQWSPVKICFFWNF